MARRVIYITVALYSLKLGRLQEYRTEAIPKEVGYQTRS